MIIMNGVEGEVGSMITKTISLDRKLASSKLQFRGAGADPNRTDSGPAHTRRTQQRSGLRKEYRGGCGSAWGSCDPIHNMACPPSVL